MEKKDKFTLNELIEFLADNHENDDIEFVKKMCKGGYISYPKSKYIKHGSKTNDPDYIEIVMLKYNQGMSLLKIKSETSLSYNTVKKIVEKNKPNINEQILVDHNIEP